MKQSSTTHANFISNHFAPIYTIPAPNLAQIDNHNLQSYSKKTKATKAFPTTTRTTPIKIIASSTTTNKPQYYKEQHKSNNHYQVIENDTNDQTIVDILSGSQKLFAPDPDPSLPTSKIRPAQEPFNQPSNGRPLPNDVEQQHNQPAQALGQIVGAPEIYPILLAQQDNGVATKDFVGVQPGASIPIYDSTYLVTQSNNLYQQHKQQLFKPNVVETIVANSLEPSYPNADLSQIVASDGQILQAAKDPNNNIHPMLDATPHFAALIAAPVLGAQNTIETNQFHLLNIPQQQVQHADTGGFVASSYFGPIQDSSQLLQSYVKEEGELGQPAATLGLEQLGQNNDRNPTVIYAQQQPLSQMPVAFPEHQHQNIVQQLSLDTPLRIFVPDEDPNDGRLKKRSEETAIESFGEKREIDKDSTKPDAVRSEQSEDYIN